MSYKEFKDDHGFLRKEWRNELGQFHREDGPAEIICYDDGETLLKAFWLNGFRHRDFGPAQIRYYLDGSIEREAFYVSGISHRESGPTEICYEPDGSIKWEYFSIGGESLGYNKVGFWAFWAMLSEEQKQEPSILKYLAKFS